MTFIDEVEIVETGFSAMSQRARRRIIKDTYVDTGNRWHQRYRGRHFTRGAFQRYKSYNARSKGYSARKKRLVKHADPLKLSGRSEKLSRTHRVIVRGVASGKHSVKVRMPVRAFNFKLRNSQVNMRAEFTEIAQVEKKELRQRAGQRIDRSYRNHRATRRTKIKA